MTNSDDDNFYPDDDHDLLDDGDDDDLLPGELPDDEDKDVEGADGLEDLSEGGEGSVSPKVLPKKEATDVLKDALEIDFEDTN